MRTTYINKHANISDLLTKNLPSGVKRTKFCKMLLHFLVPSFDVGEEADHTVTATAVKVLPGSWNEAVVGQVTVWEKEAPA